MQIRYANNKLQKSVSDATNIKKNYGTMAKMVARRKDDLETASTLEAMRQVGGANCHELKGDREGELSVSISGNHRIIFKPDPPHNKKEGPFIWSAVTAILILDIGEDYH